MSDLVRNPNCLVFSCKGSHFIEVSCLFELMLYVPVNSNGHVGMLPPFYGTFPTFMTLGCYDTHNALHNMCVNNYNHPNKPKRFISMDGLTKPLFLGRLR